MLLRRAQQRRRIFDAFIRTLSGLEGFDVLGLEAEAYEAGGELLEAGDAGEDLQ